MKLKCFLFLTVCCYGSMYGMLKLPKKVIPQMVSFAFRTYPKVVSPAKPLNKAIKQEQIRKIERLASRCSEEQLEQFRVQVYNNRRQAGQNWLLIYSVLVDVLSKKKSNN